MSSIKVEPFVFSDDEIQLNPETLPGAVEKQDKQENVKEKLQRMVKSFYYKIKKVNKFIRSVL